MLDWLVSFERSAFLTLNSPHSPYLDALMYLISSSQAWIGVWVLMALMLFYKIPLRKALGIVLVLGVTIACCDLFSSRLIKPLCQRARPTHYPGIDEVVKTVYLYRGGAYGFISGHATNYFGIAMLTSLLLGNKRYSWLIFSTAALVAYTRVYLGVHFLSDIIPGAIAGLVIGWVMYSVYAHFAGRSKRARTDKNMTALAGLWTYAISGFYLYTVFTAITVMRAVARLTA